MKIVSKVKSNVADTSTEEGADARAAVRGIVVGVVAFVNGFADRFGYTPLSGLETTGVIAGAGALVIAWRKVSAWRAARG